MDLKMDVDTFRGEEGGITRSIFIFPHFEEITYIDNIREKYDPLHNLIAPHITLVFPFTSSISSKSLKQHIRVSLRGVEPFQLTMCGITGSGNSYLFLNVKKGNDEIIRLHDRLYGGLLKEHLYKHVTFIPHMTVGRLENQEDFKFALIETDRFKRSFTTIVNEITVEIIDGKQKSNLDFKISL
ncbi:2'-5' RNA ligase family protein [Peribacillus deserti]|uniref:2'-5' RNA ligase n=1 Tax=Peribacillus deserti TaxID=673318 RepID=A0A2N5M2R5_9BACI|nr:2'-5' RNA ligase family protein [Peribacillus deserti]PLT28647.1 2'-5' RNA ligase [Peribacillus deserti]